MHAIITCPSAGTMPASAFSTSPFLNRNIASLVFATELRASCVLGGRSTRELGRSPALQAPETRKSKKMSQQAAFSLCKQTPHYCIKKTTKIIPPCSLHANMTTIQGNVQLDFYQQFPYTETVLQGSWKE